MIVAIAAIAILLAFSTEKAVVGLVALLVLGTASAALCLALNFVVMLCAVAYLTARSQLIHSVTLNNMTPPVRNELHASGSQRTRETQVSPAQPAVRRRLAPAFFTSLAQKLMIVRTCHGTIRILLAWACWTILNSIAFLGLPYINMYPFRALESGGRYGAAFIALPLVLALLCHGTYDLARERLPKLASVVWATAVLPPAVFLCGAASWFAVAALTLIDVVLPESTRSRDTFLIWFCIVVATTVAILGAAQSPRKAAANRRHRHGQEGRHAARS